MLEHPFSAILCGSSCSGKSTLVRELISKQDSLIYSFPECGEPQYAPFTCVIYVYKVFQPIYHRLEQLFGGRVRLRFYRDALPDNLTHFLSTLPVSTLIVYDDGANGSKAMCQLYELFTKGVHHYRVSVMYLCHTIFDVREPNIRLLQRNTQYLFLFKSPRDKRQIQILSSQMFPSRKKSAHEFMTAFEEETKKPYSYVWLDFRQKTPDYLRFRANLLGTGSPPYCIVRAFPENLPEKMKRVQEETQAAQLLNHSCRDRHQSEL